mgnify:CR=1 FL=1
MSIEALLQRIADKRDEVVALTQELVRIPTINPPGDAYEACARALGERLARRGFDVTYVRAAGAPGDSDAQQQIAAWAANLDAFNWGYDPFHYGAPEGSYASTAEGTAKIVEFRQMVMGLSALGLRTVMINSSSSP